MIKTVLLGSGNVAYHLAVALQSAEAVELVQRYSRHGNNDHCFDAAIPCTHNLDQLEEADIYIIAVKDKAIAQLSEKMKGLSGLVVHTSGSTPIHDLHSSLRKGVLYPVQTFSISEKVDFKNVPLAIETGQKEDSVLLYALASRLSEQVFSLSSSQREQLHIAAVFANNFSNYMFDCAETLCKEFDIPFDLLRPMIIETGKKIKNLRPLEAQTGPARRNDQVIIQKHLDLLQGDNKEIYKILSEAITKKYLNKA